MDYDHQDQAERIDEEVPLAASDLLPRIDAVMAPLSVVLTDRLSMIAAEGWWPPDSGDGMNRWTWAHSGWVRSLR